MEIDIEKERIAYEKWREKNPFPGILDAWNARCCIEKQKIDLILDIILDSKVLITDEKSALAAIKDVCEGKLL